MLSFPPTVAPTKVLIGPLFGQKTEFKSYSLTLKEKLRELGISSRIDDSGVSIGKRYSVSDLEGNAIAVE